MLLPPNLAALGRSGDTGFSLQLPSPEKSYANPHIASYFGQEAEPRYVSMHVSSVVRSPSTEAARVEQSQLNFPAPLCIIYQG